MTSIATRFKSLGFWVVLPYVVGCFLSGLLIPQAVFDEWVGPIFTAYRGSSRSLATETKASGDEGVALSPTVDRTRCERQLRRLLGLSVNGEDPFAGIEFAMHRNGETEACGSPAESNSVFDQLLVQYTSFSENGKCPGSLNTYQVEALLTKTFHALLTSCPSVETDGKKADGFYGFCDMGPKKTPILLDHNDLVPVVHNDGKKSLPCRFHTREGQRITELSQLVGLAQAPSTMKSISQSRCEGDGDSQTCTAVDEQSDGIYSKQRHLFAVPAGRVFMFVPRFVGEIIHLPHVEGSDQKPIYLEVISLEPRVFDVFNFFSRAESSELVEKAMAETRDSHRIKRSTTGASTKSLNSRRTSESGFDTHGKTAVKVKKRCFQALGFDEYWESHGDGLQILRYNVSKAYNSHMDWIEDKSGQLEHDYDSGGTGGNRFATILMYMSDLSEDDGGETVFPKGWPPQLDPSERIDAKTALQDLRASDRGDVLTHGSWEEDLVAKCRSRLSIRPHSSRAVLFYSQNANGTPDRASLHGACPVLSGQKYAANLWVWNTPRAGYPGNPIKEKFRKKEQDPTSSPSQDFKQIKGRFYNTGKDPDMAKAELFFENQRWGSLGHGDKPLAVNTYADHEWNVRVDGKIVKKWVVKEENGDEQQFSI